MPSAPRHFGDAARKVKGSIGRVALARPHFDRRDLGRYSVLVVVNLLVAAVVMALPLLAGAAHASAGTVPSSQGIGSTLVAQTDGEQLLARAVSQARGGTILAGRSPLTVTAEGVPPIPQYTLSASDTLWTIANFFAVSPESIAFANGISDPYHLQIGRQIMIPPLEGALYTVKPEDTVESVAARFHVDAVVIKSYNRLYAEPQHFGEGQLIFIENAALPSLPPPPQPEIAVVASVISRPPATAPAARSGGFLTWPVNGVITQYMWAGHTGVDIAAPYGSGLAASVNGVISQNGWVAVGGLHICVKSGNLEECFYHMSAAYEPVGASVAAGDIIGAIGLTGVTTGPHVHWETKVNGQLVNPLTVQP